MIVSLVYKVTRKLLSEPAVLLRRNTSEDAELLVLRHENAVLREQLKGPVRYKPADRFWFVALSASVGASQQVNGLSERRFVLSRNLRAACGICVWLL
ncbi:hypothetical protein ACFU8W_40775 [Streptomyces sp. NPDC057565]|uniref:hypothetical protein n=1 Tax=Streptomyces sp. NPDC057565 TaxID=3346169 RepID=UPI0036B00B82